MSSASRIANHFETGKFIFSAEFYPPRNDAAAQQILDTAEALKNYNLDFVSITYGAGGSTRARTLEYANILKKDFGFNVMPHLTCVGHSKDEILEILQNFDTCGFKNIMALRGDPPKGANTFEAHPQGLRYASELVAFIKSHYPNFCLGVGGYPEKHPEAANLTEDLQHLKHKAEQGAHFITTQLFFSNEDFFNFEARCRQLGIDIPIIPGILPAISLEQVMRFCSFCGARVPELLQEQLEAVKDDPEASIQVGVNWAFQQIRELMERGSPGVHLYILNRAQSALALFEKLRHNGLLEEGFAPA